MPKNVMDKVWDYFSAAGPKIGRPWPIRYRQSHEERVEILRAMGVRRFPTLPYAHKPGVAEYLNAQGYQAVNLDGGIYGWVDAGLPVER